jgi:hypothetical protein
LDDGDVVQEYQKKLIKEKLIEKEMNKKINNVSAFLGTLKFKLIQFCSKNIPQSTSDSFMQINTLEFLGLLELQRNVDVMRK